MGLETSVAVAIDVITLVGVTAVAHFVAHPRPLMERPDIVRRMAGGRSRRGSSNRSNRGRRPPPARRAPDTTGQVGRRPSSPVFLFAIAIAWIACGVVALVALDAAWKFVPGIVFIGIGLFFLRGAATTIVRHSERDGRGP